MFLPCNCFDECCGVGGVVHYGVEHSRFHHHSEQGDTFAQGKYPEWSSEHPIHIIGHSFGGLTARTLHAYLADRDTFTGHTTNADWVISINTMNSPLNGCLLVYSLGANVGLSPVVEWGSPGFLIGILAHIFSYFQLEYIHNFKLQHWNLQHTHSHSLNTLLLAIRGYCVHSTCDNAAYDMTIHSQIEWANYLSTIPNTFYSSTVGTTIQATSFLNYLIYSFRTYILRSIPTSVLNLDVSEWYDRGFDGLVSVRSQEFPFLNKIDNFSIEPIPDVPEHNIWYVSYVDSDHMGTVTVAFSSVLEKIIMFHSYHCRNQNKLHNTSSNGYFRRNIHKPADCQIPSWTLNDRPIQQRSSLYSSVILLFAVCILASIYSTLYNVIQSSVFPFTMTIMVLVRIQLYTIQQLSMTSDNIEIVFAITRLILLICTYFYTHPLLFIVYYLSFIADAALSVITMSTYQYCMPYVKLFLAITLTEHANKYVSLLLLVDVLSVVAKLAWRIDPNQLQPANSTKWNVLWAIFSLTVLCTVALILSTFSLCGMRCVVMLCLLIVFVFTRLRDLSDAFQAELILHLNAHRKVSK